MSVSRKALVGSITVFLIAVSMVGCAPPTGPASQQATKKIQGETQSRNAKIDSAIDQAQTKVGEAAATAGTADAALRGLGAQAQLQQIGRQLKSASTQTGQNRVNAVQSASTAFTMLMKKVDDAAAKAPAGSKQQTALMALSSKLKEAQAKLTSAVSASMETTSGK